MTTPKPLAVWIKANWKSLQEIGIPDHLTFLLRSLYAGQEATVRTLHGTKWTDSNLGKEYIKSVYFSFFSITVQDIDFNYCDIEWFALAMNRDHSVFFQIASKYCISNSFVDHDDYSISSKRSLPTVVDIMVI